jgi:hypothetical protein
MPVTEVPAIEQALPKVALQERQAEELETP